ncbi:MAG: glycosyltransferase family 2 protein [Actinobacteria bacterium]|nr:glycosyltransferase family 2 protein [Actinomycetota bacterium]
MSVEISVVVPVYGCADSLEELHGRLRATLVTITPSFELIFVDDRSPDGAWETLRALADTDRSVRALRLSRNFGEHAAVTAGLAKSTGRWTVVLDCDLQDAPEDIPKLYAKAAEGFDLVLSTRSERGQSKVRQLASRLYYRSLNFVLETRFDAERGSLSILSRKVVDALLDMRDKEYKLALEWLGFERASIPLERSERRTGTSAYSFTALLRVASDGLFFQSTALLRWIVYAGFAIAGAGGVLAVVFSYQYLVADDPVPGWTSIAVLLLILAGFIITSTGVAALYVGRLFDAVKNRPLYVVDEDRGGDTAPVPPADASVSQSDGPSR